MQAGDRINWPLIPKYVQFFGMLAMVVSESSLGDYFCHTRLLSSTAISCSCQVYMCHRGHFEGLIRWQLVAWVALCFRLKFFTPKTSFELWTQSQAISQSIAFSSLLTQWEIYEKVSIFSLFSDFIIQLLFLLPWWWKYKISPGGESAGDGRSTSKSTCAVPAWSPTACGQRPASSMSKFSPSVSSDLGNSSFSLKIPYAEHVDRRSWNMREFDRINWPLTSEMFTLLDMIEMVVSEAVLVPMFVLAGLRGSTATSDLVIINWCKFIETWPTCWPCSWLQKLTTDFLIFYQGKVMMFQSKKKRLKFITNCY